MTTGEIKQIIRQSLKTETKKLLKIVDKKIDDKVEHFAGVILEHMDDRFKAVGEANQGTNERIDRFEKRTEERFNNVDNKLIHLESDVSDLKTDMKLVKQALIVKQILDEEPEKEDE